MGRNHPSIRHSLKGKYPGNSIVLTDSLYALGAEFSVRQVADGGAYSVIGHALEDTTAADILANGDLWFSFTSADNFLPPVEARTAHHDTYSVICTSAAEERSSPFLTIHPVLTRQAAVLNSEIHVTAADDLFGELSSDKIYIIDGVLDMGAHSIEVPAGGLTMRGLGFNVSKICSTEAGFDLFTSPVGGSGDLFLTGLTFDVSGAGSQVLNIADVNGFKACELNDVNFENCTALGTITEYRQLLFRNIGIFGCADGFEFVGNMVGGARVETTIVRNFGSSGTLFKAGAGLVINGRFVTDANVSIPAGAVFCDFSEANIANDGTFIIIGALFAGGGTVLPNLSHESRRVRISASTGVESTYVGSQWTLTTPVTTAIATVATPVKVAGTTTYNHESWFNSTTDNAFLYASSLPSHVRIDGSLSITGTSAGDVVVFKLRQWVNNTASYIEVAQSPPQAMDRAVGANSAESVGIHAYAVFEENDRLELWVENQTDSSDVTLNLNSTMTVSAR